MKQLSLALSLLACTTLCAQTPVKEMRLAGPFAVATPAAIDTVDVQGKKFDPATLLDAVDREAAPTATFQGGRAPKLADKTAVGVVSFYVNNSNYRKATLNVKAPKHHQLYIDGEKSNGGEIALTPGHHSLQMKYLVEPNDTDSIALTWKEPVEDLEVTTDERHPFDLHDLFDGRRVSGVSLSANGRYALMNSYTTQRGGSSQWQRTLFDLATGRELWRHNWEAENVRWMPRSERLLQEVKEQGIRRLYSVDPLTNERKLVADHLPDGSFVVSPQEDFLIIYKTVDGPKELSDDVFEIVDPDDRQAGHRNRTQLLRYDLATGVCQPLFTARHNVWLSDISNDGKTLLLASSRMRLERRPTTVNTFMLMDLATQRVDTVLCDAEYLDQAWLSPDKRQLLFKGSPEAFDRIGCTLPPDRTPQMMDYQLYLYDLATQRAKPLTRDFDPSVTDVLWHTPTGHIFFLAEVGDRVQLYRLDPNSATPKPQPVEGQQGDVLTAFSLSDHANVVAYVSSKAMEPASAYVMPLDKAGKRSRSKGGPTATCLFNGADLLKDVRMGTCTDWDFLSTRGDTVHGRCYLPADFDPQRKYPLIVYYYGGCSPVSRSFGSPYSPHWWNALGYVAYILQPSGCTGYGQEWSARHVNTAGRGPAEDIIEGTRRFCQEHPYVDSTKVGCMGASYGGFMTQYLQTQTDFFAAAVSHAGISNHASYWGEGYWGYSYSEVSMADSYPWSHPDLYTKQSPLFLADKIHTPLLLLHGTDDTNVPIIESIQLFTALKLLGRPTALVEVKGQNHHITDYKKRERWMWTQMAWMQRWLKGDPSWWDALYPEKHL